VGFVAPPSSEGAGAKEALLDGAEIVLITGGGITFVESVDPEVGRGLGDSLLACPWQAARKITKINNRSSRLNWIFFKGIKG
jgi:hypothetical protein